MPGKLKKIVDYVAQNAVFKDLALARMTLLVKEDVTKITDLTPDSVEKEALFLSAAKEILGTQNIPV